MTSAARDKFQQTPVLDPDAIAKSLQASLDSNHSNIEAGKRVLRLAEELIAKGQTLTVETTLSGGTYLKMAERAKASGFNLMVVFVGTASVEINLERVKARVKRVEMMFLRKISVGGTLGRLRIWGGYYPRGPRSDT